MGFIVDKGELRDPVAYMKTLQSEKNWSVVVGSWYSVIGHAHFETDYGILNTGYSGET